MDGRAYDSLTKVSPTVFTSEQRRRLEAYTAAVGLARADASVHDHLYVADYIITGER